MALLLSLFSRSRGFPFLPLRCWFELRLALPSSVLHTLLCCVPFFFQLTGGEWLALCCLTPLPHSGAALSAAIEEHHFGFQGNRRQKDLGPPLPSLDICPLILPPMNLLLLFWNRGFFTLDPSLVSKVSGKT